MKIQLFRNATAKIEYSSKTTLMYFSPTGRIFAASDIPVLRSYMI